MTTQHPQQFQTLDWYCDATSLKRDCSIWLEYLRTRPMPNVIVPSWAYKDTQLSIQFPD